MRPNTRVSCTKSPAAVFVEAAVFVAAVILMVALSSLI